MPTKPKTTIKKFQKTAEKIAESLTRAAIDLPKSFAFPLDEQLDDAIVRLLS